MSLPHTRASSGTSCPAFYRNIVVFFAVAIAVSALSFAAARADDALPESSAGADAASSDVSREEGWMDAVDHFFGKYLVVPLEMVVFYDFGTQHWLGTKVPLVVVWLLFGAIFFTLRMRFINLRGFRHAVSLIRGKYDKPGEAGEVSHFQALASALSATVGLGNIAGVAIAVGNGGPGAIFWLILVGLLGMSSKFAECSLGQMYRKIDRDGTVSGGPMHYMRDGFREIGLTPLGIILSVVFAFVCMCASFGCGCAFQVGMSLGPIKEQIAILAEYPWLYGVILAIMVGVVIIGGIRRIAATAEKIVPFMCGVYVLTSLIVLGVNYNRIIPAIGLIIQGAFTPDAVYGGFLGVMVIGIKRAVFSNEAGIGSAPIAHAAAKTDEPISEGIVALLEPYIDTVVVCTMTGLVIVITGVYNAPEYTQLVASEQGASLTAEALGSVCRFFPWILCLAVFLFAYSTMISWSYYGERCSVHLFGHGASLIYKLIFLVFIIIGSIITASNIKNFADLMMLSMAFPNILAVIFLSGKVRRALDVYWSRYKAGELELQEATEGEPTDGDSV